jgi:DNA-binding MarR family transcriptional regulator
MSDQLLSAQGTQEMNAWVRLLRGYKGLTRGLSAELLEEHGLTINAYEVLLLLSQADDQRMRRVDLSEAVQLTQSGVTRLLNGLQKQGFVERENCSDDARVAYATLTAAGREKLERAAGSHVDAIRAAFADRYSDEELEALAGLLSRLPGADTADPRLCEPGEQPA